MKQLPWWVRVFLRKMRAFSCIFTKMRAFPLKMCAFSLEMCAFSGKCAHFKENAHIFSENACRNCKNKFSEIGLASSKGISLKDPTMTLTIVGRFKDIFANNYHISTWVIKPYPDDNSQFEFDSGWSGTSMVNNSNPPMPVWLIQTKEFSPTLWANQSPRAWWVNQLVSQPKP